MLLDPAVGVLTGGLSCMYFGNVNGNHTFVFPRIIDAVLLYGQSWADLRIFIFMAFCKPSERVACCKHYSCPPLSALPFRYTPPKPSVSFIPSAIYISQRHIAAPIAI